MVLAGAVVMGLAVVIGLVFYYGVSSFAYLRRPKPSQITNFQECVQAGYPVMESYPRQCRTQKGEVFVEEIPVGEGPNPEEACEDLCGDGICQEVVCLGVGCPCPETPESCPEDCVSHNAD